MKKIVYYLLTLFLFLFLFPNMVHANSAISGIVFDLGTNDILPGANVFIEGTSIGTATDLDGKFLLNQVPPGIYTVIVKYIGYKEKKFEVRVGFNQTIEQEIALEYDVIKGENVLITAQAQGQLEAINKQLASRQIVSVVASDRIQELPDANAAESVARLPGVSILREGGEGNKVVIRGLSPQYNKVMIEGVPISPSSYNDRSTDLSMMSPYMLEGIEVMKAITPDQDADAIGGSVNFQVKEAADIEVGKLVNADIIVRGGYNGLKNSFEDYKVVGELSTRLFSNKFGILAQIDVEKRNRSSQEMNADYELHGASLDQQNQVYINALRLKDIVRVKNRLGGSFVMDYRLPNGKIAFKNIYSEASTDAQMYEEYFEYVGNHHNYTTFDSENKLKVMTNILKYEQIFSQFKVDAHVAHSFTKNENPLDVMFHWKERGGAYYEINQDARPEEIPSYAKNDIDMTMLYDCYDNSRLAKDRQITAAANVEMSYTLSKQITGKLKLGGKYRISNRKYDQTSAGGDLWVGGARDTRQDLIDAFPWITESPLISNNASFFWLTPFLEHGSGSYRPDDKFLDGEYQMGLIFDVDLMRDMMDIIRLSNDLETYHTDMVGSTANDYKGTEQLQAGYIMTDLNIGSMITVIPGIRYEELRTSYDGVMGDSRPRDAAFQYQHTDTTVEKTHKHWLPMVHLRIKPVDWFDIRFAYTNTLSRPDYNLITPSSNITTGAVAWKNYNLKPLQAENYDLYLSFHQNTIGLLTVGGFVKNIKDMIYGTQAVILDPDQYFLPDYVRNYSINYYRNNPNFALVKGIEVDWQTSFWYLPSFLSNLVFNINYTHIVSEARYPQYEVKTEYDEYYNLIKTYIYSDYKDRMLHQPNEILNMKLGYDYRGFSARASMLYQSDIFKSTYYYPELRIATDDYLRFDLSISQYLPWYDMQIYYNVNNITASRDVDLCRGNGFPTGIQHYGRTADIGLRIRL